MKWIAVGLWGGMRFNVLAACAAGVRLPIVYPIYAEYVGYLPNPAAPAGILRTGEALATA